MLLYAQVPRGTQDRHKHLCRHHTKSHTQVPHGTQDRHNHPCCHHARTEHCSGELAPVFKGVHASNANPQHCSYLFGTYHDPAPLFIVLFIDHFSIPKAAKVFINAVQTAEYPKAAKCCVLTVTCDCLFIYNSKNNTYQSAVVITYFTNL